VPRLSYCPNPVGQSIATVSGGLNAGLLVGLALLLVIMGALCGGLVRLQSARRSGFDTPVLRAYCEEFGVPPTLGAMHLMGRYLQRTDRYRQAWTWIGIGMSIALSFIWRPPWGSTWGIVVYPPTSNVILMGLGFWFLGLVRSEMYNLRPRFKGTRRASLEVREVRRYLPARMQVLPRLSAAVALGLVVAALLLPDPSPDPAVIVALGVTATIALLVTEGCQRGIAHRTRPVLPPDLRAADEAIRRMASWSVAYGSAGLITMLAAFEAILMSQPSPPPISIPNVTGYTNNAYEPRALCFLLAFLLFFWALGLAWQARRMVRPEPGTRGRAAAELLQ
jgi:hypothetical protein